MLSRPICSIITVVFNNPDELELTINNVLDQNFSNYEIILSSTITEASVSIHTRAPQLKGLSGEYMTVEGPSMDTE